ncbi:sodium channel protein 60E isoform X1 [Apis cerana]|uniref:sodium channel protein 60E isoform X1 n=1 Tax=Apis cerana TaxID=7461 RepID=UPI002B22F946|nr:sodium channel protein 60E isoform X1 [Apis cerana]XP_061935842.1 sodium channel protein 60E isoform X1 [Apis cerana]XP_061935843.1 sodium channel protein 60E isoform X1 [Apis cerana]XP_061935844.1 sodium channel protein 60E isoform X1 [Apis cerana]XP_061935845.1 sodium channel protein 60E isoform X1 [Apis cerana]XP_061935846.1 sodium channel protein 60E isoform X1 [Apis cerana]XP_061935847.1 sodium channel protein 60E isoform X1 [Apis cerana]XP_061935848.1 sodium channel protein 60E isof
MIPSQGGREGYKGSPNPPSNGSEDNGFANRPRVAGLYTTNLFRQELIRSSEETGARSHGPARDILERSPREIGSQRSLNFPTGIAEEFELLDRSRIGISRTPQPLRRTEVAVGHYEPRSRFDESIRRGDHYGSSVERIRGREHEQQEGCIVPDTIRRSHAEFSEQTLWMESGIDNSKIPISTDDFAGRRGQDDSSTFASTSASILISPASETSECDAISPPEVEKPSPPPYTGLSPPEYTEHVYETSETPSPIFPNYPLTSYAEETRHRHSRSFVSDAELEFIVREERLRSKDRFESEHLEKGSRQIESEHRDFSKTIKSTDEDASRSRDVARLRPPLTAVAGASADSGTGDSGSAEIQVDPLGTPRTTVAGEILDGGNGIENGQAANKSTIKTPTNNKQTVKLFTKESLDRLENRTVQLVRDYGFQPKKRMSVEDGAVLPNKYEPFPTDLYGRPLEEIDNFIYDETFCVVSKRFRKNYIHRFTATNSWFIFSPWNPIRRYCIYLSTNQYFDYVVMATIILNCAFLAMTETIEEAEYIFLAIYTAEMVIKSIAKGFVLNKYTYLRNPWNWLDFVVITSGYATIGMEVGNLAGLRTFRVLRALKTVSIMPGLKTIINALLHSFKQLAEVMTLTIFCLMVFALFALQVYMGELRNKCVKNLEFNDTQVDWKEWTWNSSNWAFDEDEEPIICGNATGARHCNESYICLCVGPNPNHGYTNFDNFLWSMLTTFQLITLDYWEDVYNKVLSACGPISVSFFTVVVFFGSFYLINLMLAVVALSYEEEAEITNEERRKDLTDHREDSTFSFDPTKINVKTLAKEKQKKLDARKGVLLSSYTRKKTRRRRRGRSTAGSTSSGQDKGGSVPSRSVTPSPNPSPRHSNVRPSHLLLQNISPRTAENNGVHRLAPNRGMLHSRQASNNSNQQSSLDDSGVVDDHDADDVTSVEEHDRRDNKECRGNWQERISTNNKNGDANGETNPDQTKNGMNNETEVNDTEREELEATHSGGYLRTSANVPVSLAGGSTREFRVFKCNGVKTKKQMYTLPPEYLSHIVILDDLPDRNCEKCIQCCVDYEGWLRFQNCLYKVVRDPLFELTITLCIVLNTGFLAMEHHGMSESIRQALNIGNKVFTSIFTFECLLKLLALSKDFFANGWNNFDLIIVSASLIDLTFELVDGLSVIRGLRLLRVLKLAQSWTTMKVLLSIIISTIGALGNLTLVLVIVIYIFAVIGMQLFSKDYTLDKFYPDPVPRWNFNDFFHSFMMIFRILCGEWIEPLWDCMRAEQEDGPEACFAIFLPALVMGNFMVLNLFLALLLNSFNSEELKQKKEEVGEDSKLARSFDRIRSIIRKNKCSRMGQIVAKGRGKDPRFEKIVRRVMDRSDNETKYAIQETVLNLPKDNVYNRSYQESLNQPVFTYDPVYSQSQMEGQRYEQWEKDDEEKDEATYDEKNYSSKEKEMEMSESKEEECQDLEVVRDSSCSNKAPVEERVAMLPQKDPFPRHEDRIPKRPWHALVSYVDELTVGGRRDSKGKYIDGIGSFPGFERSNRRKEPQDCFPRQCYQKCTCIDRCIATAIGKKWIKLRTMILSVVDTPSFEWMILVLIFASSITLCFEDIYLDDNPFLKKILYWTNLGFCALFSIEMLLKWLALGFCKYFTSFWTILDFIIVFVSTFSLLIEENENLKVLRSLRTLRALRPLRAISRWQGMRIVVNALMYAIPSIFNVLLVCLVFWLIFSIMGVQFFGGKFFKCVDEYGELLDISIVNTKNDCLRKNYSWENSKITFDHVGIAYLALFQVATFEGWMEVMQDAVDARGVDLQPQREANIYAYFYFVIFIVCGSFFTLNLFIGVIIDNFNMLKKKYEGGVLEMFLTESQKHYYTAMKKLGRKKPQKVIKRPMNQILAMFYDLSNSRRFEIAIFILIFLNMLTMGIEHYDQPHPIFFVLEVSNAFFTTVFGLEAIVKIIGLRYHYFTVPWNLFDFLLVLASILGILMEDIMVDFPVSPTLLRVVRVFRIGRILRLIKAAKGIRKLLFALVVSLPALFNIGALLALITFIYAIIGMSVFGHVKKQGALDDMVNFETFGRSMQLLFRLMTSAGWNDVLESLMVQPPNCDPTPTNRQLNGNCGYPLLAITYFTSFIIISYMIVINMYIAIILENFNQAHQEEEIGIVEDDLEMFYIRWSKYDPHATQFINFSQLSDFIASLDPPLGISKPNMVALVSFNLPIAKGNKIHCLDILHALVKHVLGHVEESEDFRKLQEQMDIKFKKQFPTRKELEIVSSTRMWKRQDKAARLIQRTIREYITAKKERERMAQEVDSQTQTSSPGGGNEGRGGGGWSGKVSAFLHVHRGSRASSRKSSRASDASDFSELGTASAWLFPNLPLLLLSGATGTHEDLPPPALTVSRPSPTTEQQIFTGSSVVSSSDLHTRSIGGPTLGRQNAVESYPDEEVPSLPTKRKSLPPSATTLSLNTLHRDIKEAFSRRCGSLRKKHQPAPEPAPLPIESTDVSILVTEPSPENSAPPSRPALLRQQSAATVVHVLVHRESEEYRDVQPDNAS